MGVSLLDRKSGTEVFGTNFWHYRAIVEAIRSLEVLPEEKVDSLHEMYVQSGLTLEESREVASVIRERLLPTLNEGERLLWDGRRTTDPDDGKLYRAPEEHKNYSTNAAVLERFAVCCETCDGFYVS